nr:OstA-like protein [Hufsiella ginkgonis]
MLSSDQVQVTNNNKDLQHIGHPIAQHDGSTLASDSANLNLKLNTFDAFGHVVITQPDGTVIYSDLLNYDGNTHVAVLTNNVRLVDKDGAVLTTNYLTYNTSTKIGTYINNGKIENKGDVLTSKTGYYFVNTRDAYFRYNVVITNKDAVVKADTMRYNTGTSMAYFYGPTHIYGKEDTIHTDFGDYNTKTRQAHGYKNNLYQQSTKFLRGDSIFYDDIKGFGRASRNVVFLDTGSQKIMLYGQKGFYNRLDSSALITEHPYVILLTQDSSKVDSIYMTADSLYTRLIEKRNFVRVSMERFDPDEGETVSDEPDPADKPRRLLPVKKPAPKVVARPVEKKKSRKERKQEKKNKKSEAENPPAPAVDSVAVKSPVADSAKVAIPRVRPKTAAQIADSIRVDSLRRDSVKLSLDTTKTRIVLAYHHVKIFKSDLQSVSDSAFYSYKDSIIRSYGKPMIWSQGSQLSADTIYMQLKNKKLDNMLLRRNGFIVSTEGDSLEFNQVKGKVITGYFRNNELREMYVDGNAESIYFIRDSLLKPTSLNTTTGSVLRINFGDKKLKTVTGVHKMTGRVIPIEDAREKKLKGFLWRPKDRPKSKDEIVPPSPKKKTPAKAPVKAPVKKPAAKPAAKPTGKAPAQSTDTKKPAAKP